MKPSTETLMEEINMGSSSWDGPSDRETNEGPAFGRALVTCGAYCGERYALASSRSVALRTPARFLCARS